MKPRAWHRRLIVSKKPERIMHIGGDFGYESGQAIGGGRNATVEYNQRTESKSWFYFGLVIFDIGKCSNLLSKNGGRGVVIGGKRRLEARK